MINYLKDVCKKEKYYVICGMVDKRNKTSENFFNSINAKWLESLKMVVIK